MINESDLRTLLSDEESDRVERTLSTSNTDKFCEAICAFANDMPGHNLSGYLVIGARDDGTIAGLNVTDRLLQQLSNYADSGQIGACPIRSCRLKRSNGYSSLVLGKIRR